MERFEGRRQLAQPDEGVDEPSSPLGDDQPLDTRKTLNPSLFYRHQVAINGQGVGAARGRVCWIREHLPPFEIIPVVVEADVGENVFSGTRNQRFGDEATLLQRIWIVV